MISQPTVPCHSQSLWALQSLGPGPNPGEGHTPPPPRQCPGAAAGPTWETTALGVCGPWDTHGTVCIQNSVGLTATKLLINKILNHLWLGSQRKSPGYDEKLERGIELGSLWVLKTFRSLKPRLGREPWGERTVYPASITEPCNMVFPSW